MGATLFDEAAGPERPGAPLAVRMRPRDVNDLVGQRHLIGAGSPLRRLLEGDPAAAVSLKHVFAIAEAKSVDTPGAPLEAVARSIVGTARSMGIRVVARPEDA